MMYSKKNKKLLQFNDSLEQVEIQKHPNHLLKKTLEVSATSNTKLYDKNSRQSGFFFYNKQEQEFSALLKTSCSFL